MFIVILRVTVAVTDGYYPPFLYKPHDTPLLVYSGLNDVHTQKKYEISMLRPENSLGRFD